MYTIFSFPVRPPKKSALPYQVEFFKKKRRKILIVYLMFEFLFTALQATLGDVNAAIDRLLQQR